MRIFQLNFDGGCTKPSVGIGTYAWILKEGETIIDKAYSAITDCINITSNVAEFYGLGHGLRYIVENLNKFENLTKLEIYGDSQLIINLVTGNWLPSQVRTRQFTKRCREHIRIISEKNIECIFQWVPRHQNSEADALCRVALKEYNDKGQTGFGVWNLD